MATDNSNSSLIQISDLPIEIPKSVEEIAEVLLDKRKLSEPSVGPSVYSVDKSLDNNHTEPFGDLKITVGASVGGKLALGVFNDDSDKDADGIANPSSEKACLKYEMSAQGRVTAGGELAGGVKFGIDFSAEGSLRLLQYRNHGLNERLGAAVRKDITSYRFPFRATDIEKLKQHEVLAYIVQGKLGFKVELSWSDVISSTVSALDQFLGQQGIATFDIDLGAKANFSLAASDDYRLEFRPGNKQDGFIAINLRKNEQNRQGAQLSLSAGAGFANPDDLAKAINSYLSGRLGFDNVLSELNDIDQSVNRFDDLNDLQKEIVEELAERLLDLDIEEDVIDKWDDFKKKVGTFIQNLQNKVTEVIKTRVGAAFTFAYSRIKTEQTLLSCQIDRAHLPALLRGLLKGDLTELVTELGKPDAASNGYLLENYLDTEKVETTKSFGASLSLGKWSGLGKNTVFDSWTVDTNIHRQRRLAYQSRARYEGKWGPDSYEYIFELPSAMQHFAEMPKVADFETSWNMAWNWTEKKLERQTICDALDLATLWGLIDEEDMTEAFAEVLAKAKRKKAKIDVEMNVDNAGVTALLHVARNDFDNAWVRGLAAALPPVSLGRKRGRVTVGLRGQASKRIAVYEPAARLAFEQGRQGNGVEIAAVIGQVDYAASPHTALLAIDKGSRAGLTNPLAAVVEARLTWSLKELWRTGDTSSHDRPFQLGCRFFENALGPLRNGSLGKDTIEMAFKSSQKLIQAKPYNSRLMGYVVSSLLRNRAVPIDASVKVTVEDEQGQDKEIIVLAG